MEFTHHAQYYETDQGGVIHHSNFIIWMEEARIAYMRNLGISLKMLEESGIISPVLEVQCKYKSMVHFEDNIIIKVKIVSFDGLRYRISYTMVDEKTKEVTAEATSLHSFIKKDGHPANIKREMPALNGKMLLALQEGTEDNS